MFKVVETDTYSREVDKWSKVDKEATGNIPKKLAENPFSGDGLSYSFLREKRVREKRIYYLVYEDLKLVLLVAASGKKDQQATIDNIKEHLDQFKNLAENISKQLS